MAKLICEFDGVRGRYLKLYDTKLVIITKKTLGSFISGNFTDGEKTLFYADIVGVQYKKSGILIGYLQFETPSLQMNNKSDNMFSENTFTYEVGKNGITNELIEAVYNFVCDKIEEFKYGTQVISEIPDFESMKVYRETDQVSGEAYSKENHSYDDDAQNPESDSDENTTSSNEERINKWHKLRVERGVTLGKCDMCGKKKQQTLAVKVEDFFGPTRKNVCYDCFLTGNFE